jgi:carboxylesterase
MKNGMFMKTIHQEFSLLNGNEDAIIFIHGILGSPCQFRFLADELFKQGFDCFALLLPGHGGTAQSFYKTSYVKWPEYVKQRVGELSKEYKRVFVVGHSLGGLLSLDFAASNNIAGVVLINTPLAFKVNLKQLVFSMKILLSPASKDDEFLSTYRQAYSVSGGKIYEYPLWLRQFIGLFRYIQQLKKILKDVSARTLIIQSAKDESVQLRSAVLLKLGLSNAATKSIELQDSYHGYFPKQDKLLLINEISNFLTYQ